MIKVAITGGIGSGKSSVCRVIEMLGYKIYDCDKRAAYIINNDRQICQDITSLFGNEAYIDGVLNRGFISSKVFSDNSLLERLNSITHPKVIDDFRQWATLLEQQGEKIAFIESAILFESGLDSTVDRIITVSAPPELRAARAAKRDGLPIEDIKRRIASQMSDNERIRLSDYNIDCSEDQLMIPQVLEVIEKIIFSSCDVA